MKIKNHIYLEKLPNQIQTNNNTHSSSIDSINIPFVSQISFFIPQKKKEVDKLNNHQKNIENNVYYLKVQENKARENLNKTIQKEKFVISYINWCYNLEKPLLKTILSI